MTQRDLRFYWIVMFDFFFGRRRSRSLPESVLVMSFEIQNGLQLSAASTHLAEYLKKSHSHTKHVSKQAIKGNPVIAFFR